MASTIPLILGITQLALVVLFVLGIFKPVTYWYRPADDFGDDYCQL